MSRADRRKQSRSRPRGQRSRDAARTWGSVADGTGGRAPTVTWFSNAPWAPTGYGQQTAQVVRRLAAGGWPVAVAANFGLHGTQTVWEDVPIFPAGFDQYSQDVIVAHHEAWTSRWSAPSALITLFDTWVFTSDRLGAVDRIASWVPVDHLPCPPKVREWCSRPNVLPIAMAEYGRSMLHRADIDCEYVPHAIEDVFQPTASWNGRPAREVIGCPDDAFVVMMNAANKGVYPTRKAFGENLLAMSELMRAHDDVWLYMHTESRGGIGGIDLLRLVEAVGIDERRVRFVDQYGYRTGIDPQLLAALYTTADVLLACSMGEGFGIPTVEAQACGTRVIVSDFSAQPELVGDGWTVEGQPSWDPMQDAWWHVPNVNAIVDRLEVAYGQPGHSDKAVKFAAGYRADRVFAECWVPVLERLAEQ